MKKLVAFLASASALLAPTLALAEEAAEAAPTAASAADAAATAMFTVNNVWMMLATALVFIMHMGFATLEAGMTRSKNSVNILFKNTFIICIGLLTYYVCGFNLMYPGEFQWLLWLCWFRFGSSGRCDSRIRRCWLYLLD